MGGVAWGEGIVRASAFHVTTAGRPRTSREKHAKQPSSSVCGLRVQGFRV